MFFGAGRCPGNLDTMQPKKVKGIKSKYHGTVADKIWPTFLRKWGGNSINHKS